MSNSERLSDSLDSYYEESGTGPMYVVRGPRVEVPLIKVRTETRQVTGGGEASDEIQKEIEERAELPRSEEKELTVGSLLDIEAKSQYL